VLGLCDFVDPDLRHVLVRDSLRHPPPHPDVPSIIQQPLGTQHCQLPAGRLSVRLLPVSLRCITASLRQHKQQQCRSPPQPPMSPQFWLNSWTWQHQLQAACSHGSPAGQQHNSTHPGRGAAHTPGPSRPNDEAHAVGQSLTYLQVATILQAPGACRACGRRQHVHCQESGRD